MRQPDEIVAKCAYCGLDVVVEDGLIAQHKRRAGVGLFACEGALKPPAREPKGKKSK